MGSLPKEVNFYYVNINGYKSKSDCLKQIIYEQSVDVLLVTETKVYSNSSVKLSGYQVYPVVRHKSQGSGMFIAVRHGLCTSVMIDKGQGAEFITVGLGFGAVFVRMILVYGPQEKENINTVSSFYENITVQTERAVLAGILYF